MEGIDVGLQYPNDGFYQGSPNPFKGVARSTKVTDVTWFRCEPFGNRSYSTAWIVQLVKSWRAAGYTNIGIVFRSQHPTLTKETVPLPSVNLGWANGTQSKPPVSLDRYRSVLTAVLTALKGLVQWVEGESEPQDLAHFLGRESDLFAMYRVLREVVDAVDPRIKVVMPGFCFGDLWDDNPTEAVAEARLQAIPAPFNTYYAQARQFLVDQFRDLTPLVDVIEYHSNSDAAGIVPAIDYAKSLLPSSSSVEWWIGDATSAPILTYAEGRTWNPWLPVSEMNRLIMSLSNPASSVYLADFDFYRREQANLTRRKIDAAKAAGCTSIQFGMLNDWRIFGNLLLGATTGFGFQGLINDNGTLREAAKVIQAAQ